jgi:flagellar biosynthetic protein FlhB
MSEESEDESSKTEEPSQKKLDDARKKGQIASSRELTHFFMMLAFVFFIFVLGPKMGSDTIKFMGPFITDPDLFDMSVGSVNTMLYDVAIGTLMLLMLTFVLSFAAAIAPAFLQGKWVFSAEQITPKMSKISLIAGVGRLLGMKALIEFLKNLIKISVVCIICYAVSAPYRHDLHALVRATDSMSMLEFSVTIVGKILIAVCIFLFLLSIVDYLYQRFTIRKQLRMSRHEMKEEYKQQEGDPHVKGKLKQIRRERAKKRMMANVPKADVIITNPTHFAVALKYDAEVMKAPVVLAKGADEVAARIREKAGEHKIPIIRNPPLARVLYDTTEIDDEIPLEHYQAVAKIIGYVYRLKGKTPKAPPSKGPPKGKGPILKMK